MNNAQKLYQEAQKWVGKDAHMDNLAAPEVACVDSLETVYRVLTGHNIGNTAEATTSTTTLYEILKQSPDFIEVTAEQAVPGTIIIAPRGMQNPAIDPDGYGHAGILGAPIAAESPIVIYSNDSFSTATQPIGIWDTHLDTAKWATMFDQTFYFTPTDPQIVTTDTSIPTEVPVASTPSHVVVEKIGIIKQLILDVEEELGLIQKQ